VNVTATELEILSMLVGRAKYGLEIVNESNGSIKRGSVYVLLQRLEKKGFVASKSDPRALQPGSQRRSYSITGSGQLAFQAYQRLGNDLSNILPAH
jgi:DNA-binding PadR family transcriptional regulator